VVKDGALAVATVMTCTLSVDHRVGGRRAGGRVDAGLQGHRRAAAEPDALMADFSLRDAQPEDLAEIVRLVRALAEYEKLLPRRRSARRRISAPALFAPNPRLFCTLAEREGRAVGQAIWFFNFSTFTGRPGLYVEDIFVEPEHRGLGIGEASSATSPPAPSPRAARGWSGRCWTGTSPRSASTGRSGARGMDEWRVQRVDGDALKRLAERS
jgi:hypothetical protein